MFNRNLLIATGFALAASAGFAQGTYHEDDRNEHQEQRIQQGETNGTLTPSETRHLQYQQHQIHGAERRAAADGVVTPKEAHHIQRLQDKSSQTIQRNKDNGAVDY